MGVFLFIMLLVVPIAELYVIVQVGDVIGLPYTILLLIGVSVLGTVLLKREGAATYFKARDVLERGGIPGKELTDGFLILLGGALLLTPGFLTDIVGLTLILPFTRVPVEEVLHDGDLRQAREETPDGGGRRLHRQGRARETLLDRLSRRDRTGRAY